MADLLSPMAPEELAGVEVEDAATGVLSEPAIPGTRGTFLDKVVRS
jgi:hypothetical protein